MCGARSQRQVVCGIDQRNVRECLREVADQSTKRGVVLFGQQAQIVTQREQPLEQIASLAVMAG